MNYFELATLSVKILQKHGVENAEVSASQTELDIRREWRSDEVGRTISCYNFNLPENTIRPTVGCYGAFGTPTDELYAFMAACMEIKYAADRGELLK